MIQKVVASTIVLFLLASYGNDGSLLGQSNSSSDRDNTLPLFDGKSLDGWNGDANTWSVLDGVIVAGSLSDRAPRNEFLTTDRSFSDFELTLKFRLKGTEKLNCGVQFRTERIPDHHEVIGYQADIGDGVHGHLYDESRRRKFLASPDEEKSRQVKAAIPDDGWQSYRIRAVGRRIQLWLNGVQTVDYTEEDDSIPSEGVIALQIHGNMIGTIEYKDIQLSDLSNAVSIADFQMLSGHWKGEAMGGTFEETWNPPMAGEMMGMFKFVNGESEVGFYELLTIVPQGDSFVLRLKHFSKGLKGWEEKDDAVEFPFQEITENEIVFDGLQFKRTGENSMTIEVRVQETDGNSQILEFKCKRQ